MDTSSQKINCGLCKREIVDYIEDTAQAHKDCFQAFLINFKIPEEEVVQKIEHIVELQPDQNSLLHFRLGTEMIPASSQAIDQFTEHIKDIFNNNQQILVTSTLVDAKVVRLSEES
ncbi:MAG: hypothetical protein ACXAC2_00355 [Candidatus Kariarchaeaceae archaeon]|jgi:hypothetical protein